MTRTIFSAPGYRGLETYLGIFAKSNVVHVSVTTVSLLPASGSKTINTSATPLWTYTESTFSGCPGSQGIRISFISCFVRFVYADNRIGRGIWTPLKLRHILQLCYKSSIRFWDAPFLYKPWLDFVFFITLQMVLSVI